MTQKASVFVEGTYQGTDFNFAGHFLAEQGTDGDFTIDAAVPPNLAMTVEPKGWCVDANGSAIDPGEATLHGATALAICKTLDTQPGGGHGGGNGNRAHCVEPAQSPEDPPSSRPRLGAFLGFDDPFGVTPRRATSERKKNLDDCCPRSKRGCDSMVCHRVHHGPVIAGVPPAWYAAQEGVHHEIKICAGFGSFGTCCVHRKRRS